MTSFLFIFLLSTATTLIRANETEFAQQPHLDILLHNKVIKKGSYPDCKSDYETIRTLLDRYTRPITVLEINPKEGYYSLRVAQDYDATCVMISDPDYNNNILQDICRQNTQLKNIILLSKNITLAELERLRKREHFDIVLVMNGLPNIELATPEEMINAIMQLGDHTIIQTSNTSLPYYLEKSCAKNITLCRQNSYFLYMDRYSDRGLWQTESGRYLITSTFSEKTLTKRQRKPIPWQKGIGLLTFKMFCGTHPTAQTLQRSISPLANIKSSDWAPHNMIVQGNNIILIDTDDERLGPPQKMENPRVIKYIKHFLSIMDPDKAQSYIPVINQEYNLVKITQRRDIRRCRR